MSRMSTGSIASSATPASRRLISSRSPSSDSNRSSSSTSSCDDRRAIGSRSSAWAWRTSAAIRTVVSGVRSSWLTSEVNRRCSAPNSSSWSDLLLDARGHLVVGLREPGDLVVAVDGHALVEVAVGEPLGDVGGLPDGAHDLPGDDARDAGQQAQQGEPGQRERRLDECEGPLLGREREDQVELQVAPGRADRLPDDQGGHVGPSRGGHRDVLGGEEPLEHRVAQLRRHDVRGSRRGLGRLARVRRAAGARPGRAEGLRARDQHRLERPGVAGVRPRAGGGQPVQRLVEGGLGAVAVGVDAGEVALEVLAADVGLDEGGLLLALQQPVGDLGLQHEAEDQHDDAGHRERGEHDAQLHRAAPEHADGADPLGEGELESAAQARDAVSHGGPPRASDRSGRGRSGRGRSGRAGLVADAAHGEHHLGVLRVLLDLRAQPLHVRR